MVLAAAAEASPEEVEEETTVEVEVEVEEGDVPLMAPNATALLAAPDSFAPATEAVRGASLRCLPVLPCKLQLATPTPTLFRAQKDFGKNTTLIFIGAASMVWVTVLASSRTVIGFFAMHAPEALLAARTDTL